MQRVGSRGARPRKWRYGAWVGSAGRWAYVFVGAPTPAVPIEPVEGVGSTNIRKIGIDYYDGVNFQTRYVKNSIRKNLVPMLISI